MYYNRLRVFQEVAKFNSFSDAARKLGKTQPSVSQQIMLLEEEIGFKLFHRRKGKVILTPEGKKLTSLSEGCFQSIDEGVSALANQHSKPFGTIRIGQLYDQSTPFNVSKCIIPFAKEYPNVAFEVVYGSNEDIESRLIEGEIDLGISILYKDKKVLRRRGILKEKHVLVCSKNVHRQIRRMSIREIIDLNIVLDFSEEFPCFKPWVKKNAPELTRMLTGKKPSHNIQNFMELKSLLLSDIGISILPEFLCREDIEGGRLVKIGSAPKDLDVGLDITHLNYRTLRNVEKAFIQSTLDRVV